MGSYFNFKKLLISHKLLAEHGFILECGVLHEHGFILECGVLHEHGLFLEYGFLSVQL